MESLVILSRRHLKNLLPFDHDFNLETLFFWQTFASGIILCCSHFQANNFMLSNVKSLFSLKWYSNPHTIQAQGHETAIIPLSHGAPCIFNSQFVESLVLLSPRHLKNLSWLWPWFQSRDIVLLVNFCRRHYSLLL